MPCPAAPQLTTLIGDLERSFSGGLLGARCASSAASAASGAGAAAAEKEKEKGGGRWGPLANMHEAKFMLSLMFEMLSSSAPAAAAGSPRAFEASTFASSQQPPSRGGELRGGALAKPPRLSHERADGGGGAKDTPQPAGLALAKARKDSPRKGTKIKLGMMAGGGGAKKARPAGGSSPTTNDENVDSSNAPLAGSKGVPVRTGSSLHKGGGGPGKLRDPHAHTQSSRAKAGAANPALVRSSSASSAVEAKDSGGDAGKSKDDEDVSFNTKMDVSADEEDDEGAEFEDVDDDDDDYEDDDDDDDDDYEEDAPRSRNAPRRPNPSVRGGAEAKASCAASSGSSGRLSVGSDASAEEDYGAADAVTGVPDAVLGAMPPAVAGASLPLTCEGIKAMTVNEVRSFPCARSTRTRRV